MKINTFKIHFPIAIKLVALTSFLVVTVALIIAWKNSEHFSQISTDREESSADMITSSKALEVDAILEGFIGKLSAQAFDDSSQKVLTSDLAYYKFDSTDIETLRYDLQNTSLKLPPIEDFRNILQSYRSYETQLKNGDVFITSTGNQLPEPYLLIGAPLAKENGVVSHWAWGFFRINRLQNSFERSKNISLYLTDSQGKVIVHFDDKKTFSASDLSSNRFLRIFLNSEIRKKQQYHDRVLYSAARSVYGPVIVGEVSHAAILAPSNLAKETGLFILGIVLSLSFFFTVVFSHTLSKNLEKLTSFAHRIAEGDFDVNASEKIRSHDEIGILAEAFDEMTEGLKERDKIKNIFTKFHGSVITDTLMDQRDLRKGKTCEAIVFFSDIRGFTDFSNNKSPEEVVTMLNSYFEVMVGIINKHGGIVDKFVGDAIMAVWGAPHSTEEDAKNAVNACLEMRQALAILNEERIANGDPAIMIGMGLHAGPVVSGTIGSNDRLEYTVIGDTVNTASRIESSTKAFGTDLLVSEEVMKRVDGLFLFNVAGSTKVKGKPAPLKLAKVNGLIDEEGNSVVIVTPYSSYEAEETDKVKVVA